MSVISIATINSEIPRSLLAPGSSVSCLDPNPSGLPMAAFREVFSRRFASLLRACAGGGGAGSLSILGRYPFLQKRPLFQPALPPYVPPMILQDDRIAERIRGLSPYRSPLDVILPPAPTPTPELKEEKMEKKSVSLEEAKKVIRASQVASVRSRLLTAGESCISYSDFVRICSEATNSEQGLKIARSLDESGLVLVFGNVVFLKPEEVTQTVENMIPSSLSYQNDRMREELKKMEEKKLEIEKKAAALVRKELWLGLGFMLAQTAGLMRLTFWELSWDVMEPICFYLTSFYFLAGYSFFLRTSKEPCFESFFASRLATKQRSLMEEHKFNLTRFNELCQIFGQPLPPTANQNFTSASYCHCTGRRSLVGSSQ
ncbi:calcium uniporter protein 3, mitochondrial-like [Zingiber officinale]|uniref:Calcium uniporter protein C-terminal domain-containing protein n=1 Tax=Zingiber officinale TaxID=94328 RepID=A0A8J5LVD8_ZINOF|nr:calcium uniporter protein 3, mitochondrial-like [Zingiber officinale]KAG6524416.1 hypothetical protein ZIOFF_014325 [Zingiber officinale]